MANDPETNPQPVAQAPAPKRKRKKKRRWVKRLILLTLIAAAGFGAMRFFGAKAKNPEEQLKDPIKPKRDRVEERLLESGSVELRNTLEVKSKMSGKVKELLVEEGDTVVKDQVLAIIEPDPNEILRLYQKRAAVESRLITLLETERELERARQLHERKVMPGDQFEKIRDTFKSAQTNHQLAELELQALEREVNPGQENPEILDLTTTGEGTGPVPVKSATALSSLTDIKVVAPISGLVIQRPVEVGELVISGTATTISGTTILELGDPAEIIIRAGINEVDIGKIKVGQEVKVEMSAYEGKEFPAKVARISPIGIMSQGQSIVSFKVEIRFDELSDQFMPGMTCDLDLLVDARNDALALPHHAIFQEKEKKAEDLAKEKEEEKRGPFGGPPRFEEPLETEIKFLDYVWVKKGDDWEKREVKIGLKGQKLVEILEGITIEDQIYPEAERMRWIMEERERKANKRWFWQKAPEKEESAKDADGKKDAEEKKDPASNTDDQDSSSASNTGQQTTPEKTDTPAAEEAETSSPQTPEQP